MATQKKKSKSAGRGASQKSAAKPEPAGRGIPVRERLKTVKPSGSNDDSFFDLVHEVARQIPKGRELRRSVVPCSSSFVPFDFSGTSYGAIAAALGARKSARMVGWAMITAHMVPNPVPAHRVVNRNGLLTGRHHYHPPERMQQLLEKEGVVVKDNAVVDFKRLFWDPLKEL